MFAKEFKSKNFKYILRKIFQLLKFYLEILIFLYHIIIFKNL